MVKINRRIEIVRTTITSLSSMSQRSCDAILATLSKHYAEVEIITVNNPSDLENLAARKPDLVFLGMKFVPLDPDVDVQASAKIWIANYLDGCGIAYTGSAQAAHNLELNKPLAKQRALDAGLKTSPFYVIKQNQVGSQPTTLLNFPLFIKPTNRGGGLGVDSHSVAHTTKQLRSKVRSITNTIRSDSLIEEYLPGREFSVAILKARHEASFLIMPIELVADTNQHGLRLLSGDLKSSNEERVLAVTDSSLKAKLNTLAINIFHALGARDYGRIDIRLDEFGTPQFLEANLIPSLISGYGSFPKACVLNIDLGYETMLLRIVELGLRRHLDNGQAFVEPSSPSRELGLVAAAS